MYYNFFNALKLSASFVFFLCFNFSLKSQDKKSIDSLKTALETARNEQDVLKIKVELASENFYINHQECLSYSSEAYDLAVQLGDTAQIIKAGKMKGQMLRRFDRLQEAIDILSVLAPLAQRHKYYEDHRKILNALALAHIYKADYDKALEYNFEAIIACEKANDKVLMSAILINTGLAYFKLHNYQQAIQYYTRSLDIKKEIGDRFDLDRLLINLGLCYNQIDEFSEGQKFVLEGLRECGGNCKPDILLQGKFGLGVSYFMQEDYQESQQNFEASYKLAVESGDLRWQAENLIYLGQIQTALKDFIDAKKYYAEAEKMVNAAGYPQLLMDLYRQLSVMHTQLKEYEYAARLSREIYSIER